MQAVELAGAAVQTGRRVAGVLQPDLAEGGREAHGALAPEGRVRRRPYVTRASILAAGSGSGVAGVQMLAELANVLGGAAATTTTTRQYAARGDLNAGDGLVRYTSLVQASEAWLRGMAPRHARIKAAASLSWRLQAGRGQSTRQLHPPSCRSCPTLPGVSSGPAISLPESLAAP